MFSMKLPLVSLRRYFMDLTDQQWTILSPHLPQPPRRADGKGRPRRDDREILDGVLWILRTGAAWHDLPDC